MSTHRISAGALLAALALAGTPALAHHSTAAFDFQKTVEFTGTVKDFQWTNPHIWLQLVVPGEGGKSTEWSIEGTSPNVLSRQGWTKHSVKAGEKVTVTVHPLKDGRKGGFMVSAKLSDGTVLYNLPQRPK